MITMITYSQYCFLIDSYLILREDVLLEGIGDNVLGFFKNIQQYLSKVASTLGVGLMDIVSSLKQGVVFEFLKKIGFSFQKVLGYLKAGYSLIQEGIDKVFAEISKSGIIQQLKAGTLKIDEVLNKYPLLKKASGIALAGLLIYIWMNMSFVGDFSEDFDVSNIFAALSGDFTLTDLFLSPSGLKFLTMFATGGLISFPWVFGSFPVSLIIALVYTGYKKYGKNKKVLDALRSKIASIIKEAYSAY